MDLPDDPRHETHEYRFVQLPDGIAVAPVGQLDREGRRLWDERVREAVAALNRGRLYVDCGGMPSVGTEGLGNLIRLSRLVNNRDSRLKLCNLSADQEAFLRHHDHGRYLEYFDVTGDPLPQ